MDFKIKIENTGPIAEGRAPEAIQAGVDRFITEVLSLLEVNVKRITPIGVGGSQGGLESTIHGEAMNLGTPAAMGIVGHQSAYGDVIEMGRRPGSMPPEGSLVRWIQTIMLPGASEAYAKSIEFVVRRKIAQKGFSGAMMFEYGFEMSTDAIQQIADDCGVQIAFDLGGNA